MLLLLVCFVGEFVVIMIFSTIVILHYKYFAFCHQFLFCYYDNACCPVVTAVVVVVAAAGAATFAFHQWYDHHDNQMLVPFSIITLSIFDSMIGGVGDDAAAAAVDFCCCFSVLVVDTVPVLMLLLAYIITKTVLFTKTRPGLLELQGLRDHSERRGILTDIVRS